VGVDTHLIVEQHVTQHPNDKQEIEPALATIEHLPSHSRFFMYAQLPRVCEIGTALWAKVLQKCYKITLNSRASLLIFRESAANTISFGHYLFKSRFAACRHVPDHLHKNGINTVAASSLSRTREYDEKSHC